MERLSILERLALAPTRSWVHWSFFFVAEIDGAVVASAAAFDAGTASSDGTIRTALRDIGWSADAIEACFERIAPLLAHYSPPPAGAWTLDHVATLPEFRRRGLAAALLDLALARGRALGYRTAQLDVRLGNDTAERIYRRAGFHPVAEFRGPEFERILASPGMLRMVREPI